MSNSEIISICQQLHAEGKTPSVALIKARMSGPKILPNIIAGLKAWQASPNQKVTVEIETAAQTEELDLEQRVTQLEQMVEQLKKQIAQLKS